MKSNPILDQLVAPLGDCLTPESARRLLALKADPKLQACAVMGAPARCPGALPRGRGGTGEGAKSSSIRVTRFAPAVTAFLLTLLRASKFDVFHAVMK